MFSVDSLRDHALTLGFDLCGIAPVTDVARLDYLRAWVAKGYAGDLHYLTRSVEARLDPTQVLPGARSAIVTGTLYHTDAPLSQARDTAGVARIARAGKDLTREKLIGALEGLNNNDFGGYRVTYGGNNRHGSRFVELTVVGPGGKLLK